MSGAKLLEFGNGLEFGNLEFSDLEIRLEDHLARIKTLPDLEKLIHLLNPLFKTNRFTFEELAALKRLRQRAYDRRRNPKFQITNSIPNIQKRIPPKVSAVPKPIPAQESSCQSDDPKISQNLAERKNFMSSIKPSSKHKSLTFVEGAQRALSNIDGEKFVKTAPVLFAYFVPASLVSFLLWQQSVELYDSAGFKNSLYAAAGGLFMVIGFAAYHSITRSALALLLCIYASAYEGYLIISGTIQTEYHVGLQEIQNDPEIVILKMKAEKALVEYYELKQRHDNPESKVFQNKWFFKNHVDKAWLASIAAHKEFVDKKSLMIADSNPQHDAKLKILYRLGLVFLCMILVHRFFSSSLPKQSACAE